MDASRSVFPLHAEGTAAKDGARAAARLETSEPARTAAHASFLQLLPPGLRARGALALMGQGRDI